MASIEEIRDERLKKVENLKKVGINPYPASSQLSFYIKDLLPNFEKLEKTGETIFLVGRIMAIRGHGGVTFVDIDDGTGRFQALLKKDELKEEQFNLFVDSIDIGDFVELYGFLFVTKRNEKTLTVKSWRILSKSLRPLPGEYYGFKDEEDRLRKRYLDILMNHDIKEIFYRRSKFWLTIRNFLLEYGFLEVETPILENTAGGAEARPFITHHNALDLDVYLRISAGELWQKRLMVAGFPKVFEIGRIFRNEGMDAEHLQDYTQMEFYWAYADYNDGMKLVREMYKKIAQDVFGTLKFNIKGFEVDFEKEWQLYDYVKTIKEVTGIDIEKADLSLVEKKLCDLKVEYDKEGFNLNRAIDNLWKYCRRKIAGPGFLINVPVSMEPLAKRREDNSNFVERFQVIIAGSEVGKGFSELNDPLDQAQRFKEQSVLREAGDEEAQMYDADYIEAMEYGMPPTCGFGVSERLFSFLMDKPSRDCQIFPLMKPLK